MKSKGFLLLVCFFFVFFHGRFDLGRGDFHNVLFFIPWRRVKKSSFSQMCETIFLKKKIIGATIMIAAQTVPIRKGEGVCV